MKNMIPNIITLLNLFSGCVGLVFALNGELERASLMIFVSLILDYMDGTAARLLNAKSPIGKELDSLADVVSFGVLPSMIAFMLLNYMEMGIWSYYAFLMAMFSAYRLGKFNIDTRQSENFIGLPTPANALLWSSLPFILTDTQEFFFHSSMRSILVSPVTIFALLTLFSFLLVAEIPMFSLKFKNFSWGENQNRFIFLILTMILILTLMYYSVPFILILYVLISILQRKKINT